MTSIMKWPGIKINQNKPLQRTFRNKFYMGILTSKRYPEEIEDNILHGY